MLLGLLGNLDHQDLLAPLGPLDLLDPQDSATVWDLRYFTIMGLVVAMNLFPSEEAELKAELTTDDSNLLKTEIFLQFLLLLTI